MRTLVLIDCYIVCSHLRMNPFTSCSGDREDQGAKEVIFTACLSGKLKLAYTSPNIISPSPQNFLMSRIDFTVLL